MSKKKKVVIDKKTGKKLTKGQIRRRRRKKLLIAEAIILVLLLAVLFVWMKFGMIKWDDLKNLLKNDLDPETEEMLKGYTNIAFFGVDNRSNGHYESGNSDSIMVCSINNDTKEVKLVSIYRDTSLDVGDDKIRKCNYAYNHGGVEESINMINRNLDLDIEEYVAVDFYALVDAVDAVGGIEMELSPQEAKIMNDSYIGPTAKIVGKKSSNVSSGVQTLDGVQTVSYCRIRYTAGGDFKRAERQRDVVMKLADKAKNANIGELNQLVNAVFPNISTSLSMPQVLSLASAIKSYQLVDTCGFPFQKYTGTFGKRGSLVVPCTLESNVKELHAYLFGTQDYQPSATVKEISDEIVSFSGKTEASAEKE